MSTYHFSGSLTATGNLTVSRPGSIKGKMPRLPNGLPLFPSGSLNGLFRHTAHEGLVAHLAAKKVLLPIDAHYMLASGVDTARQVRDLDGKPGAELPIRKANPILSVFGRWKLAGRLGMGDAIAQDANCIVSGGNGSRSHPFRRNQELIEYVDEAELERLNAILSADADSSEQVSPLEAQIKSLKTGLRNASGSDKDAIKAQIAEIETQIKEIKSEREGAQESVQRPLEPYECIAAGTVLDHEMRLHGGTPIELGVLLWTIRLVASRPVVGGHKRAGAGEFSAAWEVSRYDFGASKPVRIGSVSFDRNGLKIEGEDLLAALAEFEADLEAGKIDLQKIV